MRPKFCRKQETSSEESFSTLAEDWIVLTLLPSMTSSVCPPAMPACVWRAVYARTPSRSVAAAQAALSFSGFPTVDHANLHHPQKTKAATLISTITAGGHPEMLPQKTVGHHCKNWTWYQYPCTITKYIYNEIKVKLFFIKEHTEQLILWVLQTMTR